MREYDIKMLIRKVMNENGGNPYHDEKGKFTFSPSGVGASFEKPDDFFNRLTKISENLNKVRKKQMELLNEGVQYEESYDRAVKELGFTDKDVESFVGIYDINHDGYLEIKDSFANSIDVSKNKEIPEEATNKNIEKMSESEKAAIHEYTGEYGNGSYSSVNKYFRTGEGGDSVKEKANLISSALSKSNVGQDTQLYRGISPEAIGGKKLATTVRQLNTAVKRGNIKDATKILQNTSELIGKTFKDKAPMSTSSVYDNKYTKQGVLLAINAKKDTKGSDIYKLSKYGGDKDAISKKFGSSVNDEREVLLAPNTELKFTDVKLTSEGILIECDIESQK